MYVALPTDSSSEPAHSLGHHDDAGDGPIYCGWDDGADADPPIHAGVYTRDDAAVGAHVPHQVSLGGSLLWLFVRSLCFHQILQVASPG